MRHYIFERDEQGKPTKMIWQGDSEKEPKVDNDRRKLEEWERVYGKRTV